MSCANCDRPQSKTPILIHGVELETIDRRGSAAIVAALFMLYHRKDTVIDAALAQGAKEEDFTGVILLSDSIKYLLDLLEGLLKARARDRTLSSLTDSSPS